MRRRMSIQVQGEGYQLPLQPGKQAVFGTAADTQVRYPQGSAVRERHAELHWRDDRWVLADLDGYPGIYRGGQQVTEIEVTQPETVRLGGPFGPIVALTPLHRPAPKRRMRWLLTAAGILLVASLALGVVVANERTVDHRSYVIGTCVKTKTHWSTGRAPVRPPGQGVDCENRFDYKVIGVIPVPTPELTVANSDNLLHKRAIELSYGRCPPSSWPALGLPDPLDITHEIYCVRDSIYTIDKEALKRSPKQCVLRDGGKPLLAASCRQRHDYIVEEIDSLAEAPFPGDEAMAEIGENRCDAPSGLDPFHANERTWNQDYHWILCLAQDNLEYEYTIEWAVKDLRAFWDKQLTDISPKPSAVTVLEERDYDPKSPPTCGEDRLENNAWYCHGHGDKYVGWDPRWLKSAFYDKYGDIAVAIVLAHEWGHVIQDRLGLNNKERLENLSAADLRAYRVRKEYQADCYAGVWLQHYYQGGDEVVVPAAGTDRNKAVHAIVDIADTSSFAAEKLEESAHGDALQRTENLLNGYREGWRSCQAILPA
jgi:predicted metalloprotease